MEQNKFEIDSFLIMCPSCEMRLIEVHLNDEYCSGKCDHCLSEIGGHINVEMHHNGESKSMCYEMYNYVSNSNSILIHELEQICKDRFDTGYGNGFEDGEKYGHDEGRDLGYSDGYYDGIKDTMDKYNLDE